MPYKSKAQQAKFHALLNEGKISKKTVEEFDKASKGMKLPERVKPKKFKTLKELKDYAKSKK